jgi:hypothetical protein
MAMIERLARRRNARGQFRLASEAKTLIPVRQDLLVAKSHRGLHLFGRDEECLEAPVRALRAAYGSNVVIQPRSLGEPAVAVRIGLERSELGRVRCALSRRGANPSEEYEGVHYCVLRFEARPTELFGLPAELAALTSGRFSHQILLTGYR